MSKPAISLSEILAAIDFGAREVWKELTDEQKKEIRFYFLNRYASVANGPKERQELAVLKTNEYFNKHWSLLSSHPELRWQLLCLCGNVAETQSHTWIGFKQSAVASKTTKMFKKLKPNMKEDEIELLAQVTSKHEIEELIRDLGEFEITK